ncbi:hypothetical protein SCHPADRAFT_942828 [Schizopora paradoxa]|uniref:DUF6533 domain-containing protein n=1 Tax=Schizopora paradoxa TaxID=27342 RepID=A0A0H2RFY2_9AGAM|nr:hypothetical protein SCHPADRAFT_942828 [Schizopora paradoxa]
MSTSNESIIKAVEQDGITKYVVVATVTLSVYEYLIRLDSEIRYLWNRTTKFTTAKALFFLCRYFPFLSFLALYVYVVTTKFDKSNCLAGIRVNACFVYIQFAVTIMVLFKRTSAVWGGTRWVSTLLIFVYIVSALSAAVSTILYMRGVTFKDIRIEAEGCVFVFGNDLLWISLAILFFCENLGFLLLVAKSVLHIRATKDILPYHGSRTRNILVIMVQDGIGYFAFSLACTAANLAFLKHVAANLHGFFFIFQGAIQNILCARLLVHIKAVSEAQSSVIGTSSATAVSVYYRHGHGITTNIVFQIGDSDGVRGDGVRGT